MYVQNIRVLLENPFLHEGHMGLASSSFFFELPSEDVGVEATEEDAVLGEEVSRVNLTSIRFFRLHMTMRYIIMDERNSRTGGDGSGFRHGTTFAA